MLELSRIREQKEDIIEKMKVRNFDTEAHLNNVIKLDEERKNTQTSLDHNLAEANKIAKSVGQLFKEGKQEDANALKAKASRLKISSQELKSKLSELEDAIRNVLYLIPNVPNAIVPKGNSEEDNEIILEEGAIPTLHADAIPHWELAKQYNIIDFELGVKSSRGLNFMCVKCDVDNETPRPPLSVVKTNEFR